MASIEKRISSDGKTFYRVKVRLKGSRPQSATFTRKTDAKHWAESIEAAIREGRHFDTTEAKRRTIDQFLQRYEEQVVPNKKNQKTQIGMIHWWRAEIGHLTLANVSPAVVADCRDKLGKGVTVRGRKRSPATVAKYLRLLSHAFSIAEKDWGWTNKNPVASITKPKEPRGRVRCLDDAERAALLTACKESSSKALYPVVLLAISTGMRRGEIMSIRWKDINFKTQSLVLYQTKNDERRSVPLVEPALSMLKSLSKVRHIGSDLVFPSQNNPANPIDLRTPWETAVKKSGVDDFRFHDLRHTAASYMAMNGASLLEISEILGHKNLQMVKRYAHLTESHTHKIVSSMSERYLNDA